MSRIFRCVTASVLLIVQFSAIAAPEPDKPFIQAVSLKYPLENSLKGSVLKKIVADYNDNVYVLADKGVYRTCDDRLIKDIRYTPLADKVPVDITIQEKTGHLYYLYTDHLLSNAYAGKPYVKLPAGKYDLFAVNSTGKILLAGTNMFAIYSGEGVKESSAAYHTPLAVYAYLNEFYVLTSVGIYKLVGDKIKLLHKGKELSAITFHNDDIIVGTPRGYYGVHRITGDSTGTLKEKLPVPQIRALHTANGKICAGTNAGGFMQEEKDKYRYYASRRWLDDDHVKGLTSDKAGNLFFLTANAVNEIRFTPQTLAQKTTYFQDKIRKRHIRYGFIANVTFKNPGDVSTAQMTDTDNDGLWSAFYLGSQAFRYGVTADKDAQRYAWEAFEAFERIISINPLKGFPARTFERKGFKHSDPSRWHDSQEEGWEWKGTTSSDEFVGYIWVAAVMHQMVAKTKEEKLRVAAFIDQILTHIIDNDYYFVDADGKPTLWGRWNPSYINSFPESVGDRRLGSTTIIAGLQLGCALTGKQRYKTEAEKLMKQHGYLRNIQLPYNNIKATPGVTHLGVDLGSGGWNHSDDEMAFLTYWVLYHYAFDSGLREKYRQAILDHWEIERPEKNAVWNLISFGTIGVYDNAATLWHLREFPMDLVRWDIRNSHRKDIQLLAPNFRNQFTSELLPPSEKPIQRHNANAFILDGGERGMTELAGDEYLLPYWMARYLKVID